MIPNQNCKIILASQSPRRKQLLAGLDVDFEVMLIDGIEENFPDDMRHQDIPEYLARQKSEAYIDELQKEKCILITADTIVLCNNQVIGKPATREEAYQMLSLLANNKHEVITGVCLRTAESITSFSASSYVWFGKLTHEEILYYLDHYKPYDKAGSYGIQEWIGYVAIERIEGSFYNVMGLPVHRLYEELKKLIITCNNS